MTSAAPIRRWHIPTDEQPPDDLPAQWASAIAAISHDVRYRRHGRTVSFDHVAWALTADADGSMHIGMATSSNDADLAAFSRGAGFTVDTNSAQATVWIAETIQDELAGYEFVQWPMDGQRLLTPALRNGQALWMDSSTDTAVAPIGSLDSEPPHAK